MAWGVSSVFAMLIVSEFVIPVYLKGAMSTTPDFLENRYDPQTKKLVSLVFLIGYMVNLLPMVLYTGAVALNGLFHFSDIWDISYGSSSWILVWCIGLIGSLYSILGGLKSCSSWSFCPCCSLLFTSQLPGNYFVLSSH